MALSCSAQDDASPRPAVPIEPIGAIINAFKSHDIVALDEGDHGNEQGHAFRLALIRDPRFAAVVDDIVVEFGNAMYQETMDRFVRGEDVPERELRRVWQDTTVATPLWDRPIYEEFYRAVRDVNAKLPSDHQLRVLLGDSPIDWSKVTGPQDFLKIEGRDSHPAGVIQREVLSKKRRALVIYGGLHFIRKQFEFPMNDEALAEELYKSPTHSIVGRLESLTTPAKVFSISTHTYGDLKNLQSDIGSWSPPVLVIIRNTSWGRAPFFAFYPVDDGGALYVRNPDGSPGAKLMSDPKRIPSMQDQVDAVLYLGPPEAMTRTLRCRLSPPGIFRHVINECLCARTRLD